MLEGIKKSLKPTEETKKKIKEIKKEIRHRIEQQGYESTSVGSTSRGTYLPGDIDIDIFFYMPKDISREELEEKGIKIGEKALEGYNPKTHYAEHPYVKGEKDGIEVEVVPCYKTEGKIKSAVDRSPLHDEYLQDKLSEEDKSKAKVLKKFMKNIGCYGAKEEVRGFSGYLCELLILRYGSFKEVLKAASDWNRGKEIDIEEHGEEEFDDPLVVIDPVDPERNVAAALSREKLGRFIAKSRELLENFTRENFKAEVEIDENMLEDKNLVLVELPYPEDTVEEIGWSQLRKLQEDLKKELDRQEFHVYRAVYWTDEEEKAEILFDVRSMNLPRYEKHEGPPIYKKKHVDRFKEENNKLFIEGDRIYAWRERENTRIEEAIKSFFQDKNRVPSRFRDTAKNPRVITDIEKIKEREEILKKYFRP